MTIQFSKIFALIGIIALGTLALMLYSRPMRAETELPEKEQSAVMPKTSAQTRLFFAPSMQTLRQGETKEIPLLINTGTNELIAAQVELRYNPSIVTINSIRPGTFFTNPNVLVNEIDPNRGRVNYALKQGDAVSVAKGTGTVIYLSLTTRPEASGSGESVLHFMPKTTVRSETPEALLLQSTEDLRLEIVVPTMIPSVTATM